MTDNMTKKLSFADTQIAFSYKSDLDLKKSYLIFSSVNNRMLVKLGTNMVKFALKVKAPVDGIIKKTLFQQFCGGESIEDCENTVNILAKYGVGAILDFSIEGKGNDETYDTTTEEILRTIDMAGTKNSIPFSVFKPTGISSGALLEKIQLGLQLSDAEEIAYQRVRDRYFKIGKYAYEKNVRLFIDAEDSWYQDPIDALVYEMMAEFNKEKPIIFNTYQMYRVSMFENLKNAIETGREKGYFIGAKLVRGAYMEKERERAEENGYSDPIMPDKEATDKQYNDALKLCVENIDRISFCNGSHNEESNLILTELMAAHGISEDDKRIHFAQLYGMSDNISFNLAHAGYNVVKYLPYGPVASVMPYLFRRAEENTSIAGQSSRELNLVRKELKRRNSKS